MQPSHRHPVCCVLIAQVCCCALQCICLTLFAAQVEDASYKKHGGFDGVQEARRHHQEAQAAARLKRKSDDATTVSLQRLHACRACDSSSVLQDRLLLDWHT